MHPHMLYFLLAISYAESAVCSAREGNWHDAVHQALVAMIYAFLTILTFAPAALITAMPDTPTI
jgi:hypothetical protein